MLLVIEHHAIIKVHELVEDHNTGSGFGAEKIHLRVPGAEASLQAGVLRGGESARMTLTAIDVLDSGMFPPGHAGYGQSRHGDR
jgi:hypothetical protein